jgi:hypothetical protein
MNGYTQLLRYIKNLADQDIFINTVTQGNFEDVDINKKNIFPLLHCQVGNAIFVDDVVIRFDVQIGVFDIRDINKEVVTDKFNEQDNEQDNLNETLAVLNRIFLIFYKDFDDLNYMISENPQAEQFTEQRDNLLDGWILTFQVDIPNLDISLCP